MNRQGEGKISYLDYTWNVITGCLHGCGYCWARTFTHRFEGYYSELAQGNVKKPQDGTLYTLDEPLYRYDDDGKMRKAAYPYGFNPTFHKYRLDEPARKKRPSIIGVVYMGDLFGRWIPDSWIQEIFKACEAAPWHTYMFLTKNPKRYAEYADRLRINWCIGTTITGANDKHRIKDLIEPYTFGEKFISIEPLLSDIELSINDLNIGILHKWIDWAIIGQQTGPGAKPPQMEWVESIIEQCRAAGVPVFVKNPLYKQFPIQEWPEGLEGEK